MQNSNRSMRSYKSNRQLDSLTPHSPIDDNVMRRSYILSDTSLLQQKVQECEGLRDRNERLSNVNKELQEINQMLHKQLEDIKRLSQDRPSLDSENEVQTLKLLLLERENEIQNYKLRNSDMQFSVCGTNRQNSPNQKESYEVLLNQKDYEIGMLTTELQKMIQRHRFTTESTEYASRNLLSTPSRGFLSTSTRVGLQGSDSDAMKKENRNLKLYSSDLENQIEDIKSHLLQKDDQLMNLSAKLAQKEQSLKHYDKILQDSRHKEDYLEKKVAILAEELERMDQAMRVELGEKYENELQNYATRLQILEQESKATIKMSHNKMQHELNLLNDEISTRDARISQFDYECKMKDEQLDVMSQQIKKLETYIKIQSKQKEAREVLEQTIREKITLENEVADLIQKTNQLEQEKDIILEQCQNVREMADVSIFFIDHTKIEQRNNTNLTDQINTSKKEIQYLRAQTIDKERQMLIKDKIIKEKTLDIKKLQDQIHDLMIQLEKFTEVQQDNESLVHQIDSLYEELQITRDLGSQVLTDLDSQKSHEILILKDQIKYFEVKMIEADIIKQQVAMTNLTIIELERQLDSRDTQIHAQQQKWLEDEHLLKQEILALNQQVQSYLTLEEENTQLKESFEEMQKKMNEQQRSNKQVTDKQGKLENQLQNAQNAQQKSDQTVKQLREQIRELEKSTKESEKTFKLKIDEEAKKSAMLDKQIKSLTQQNDKLGQQVSDREKNYLSQDEDFKRKQQESQEARKKQDQEKKSIQDQLTKSNKDLERLQEQLTKSGKDTERDLKEKERLSQIVKTQEAKMKESLIDDATETLASNEKQIQQKNTMIKKLQDQLKEKDKALSQQNKINKDNEEMQKAIQQLQAQLDGNEQEKYIAQLEKEVEDLKIKQKQVDTEDKQVKQKDIMIKKLQDSLKEKDKILLTRASTISDQLTQIDEINKYADELEGVNTDLSKQLEDLKDPTGALVQKDQLIASLKVTVTELTEGIAKQEKDNLLLEKKIKDQLEINRKNQDKLREADKSPKRIQDQDRSIKDLNKVISTQDQDLKNFDDQLKQKDTLIARLQTEVKEFRKSPKKSVDPEIEKQLNEALKSLKNEESIRAKLEIQVKSLNDRNSQFEKQIKENATIQKEWEAAYEDLEKQNKIQMSEAQSKIKQSQSQVSEMNKQMSQSQLKIKDLQESPKKIQQTLEQQIQDLTTELVSQDKLISDKDLEITKLNKDIKASATMDKQIKQKDVQIKQLQDKLKDAQTSNQKVLQKLKDENLKLKQEFEELDQLLLESEAKVQANLKISEEADSIRKQFEDLLVRFDSSQKELLNEQDKCHQLSSSNDELKQRILDNEKDLQGQATQNQSNQKLVEDLVIKQQKIVELNTIIIDRDAELDDLILQLKSMQREIEGSFAIETELKLQINEYARLKLDHNDLETALKQQIESLSGLLREKDQQLNKSQREISDLSKKVRANPNQDLLMRTKEQQLKDFQSQQTDKDRIIAEMELQIAELEADVVYLRQVVDDALLSEKLAQNTILTLQEKSQEQELLERVLDQKNKQILNQLKQLQESQILEYQIEMNNLMKRNQTQADDIDKLTKQKFQLEIVIASLNVDSTQKPEFAPRSLASSRSAKEIQSPQFLQ